MDTSDSELRRLSDAVPRGVSDGREIGICDVGASVEGANVRSLCRRFGISPTSGYKWLERWRVHGMAGLPERSRRPQNSPLRSVQRGKLQCFSVRAEHPAWGGRKIARRLKDLGHEATPAPSTVTAILRRHGVELGAFGGGQSAFTRFERSRPNELWQMDFKGHVALHAGRLHPLTVLDDHSRFAVVLAACANERTETVRQQLIVAFRRYGLPERLIARGGLALGRRTGQPVHPARGLADRARHQDQPFAALSSADHGQR